MAVQTQWNRAGMAGALTGLNYPAVVAVMDIQGVLNRAEIFAQLQVIELAVLAELNRK